MRTTKRKRKRKKRRRMGSFTSHGSAMPSHSLPTSAMTRNSCVLRSLDPYLSRETRRSWLDFISSTLPGCQSILCVPAAGRGIDPETLLRYTPIIEQEFKEHIFSLAYEGDSMAEQDPFEAHKLALLFFVLAIGKLTDPRTRDLATQDAMKYFHIGRAALTLNQSLETPSIPLLQGLLVMCHFMFLANIESSRWLTMGIVVKLSQSVRLFPVFTPGYSSAEGYLADWIA